MNLRDEGTVARIRKVKHLSEFTNDEVLLFSKTLEGACINLRECAKEAGEEFCKSFRKAFRMK